MMQKHTLTNHNHNKHRQRCRDGSPSLCLNSHHSLWHTATPKAIPAFSLLTLAALSVLTLNPNTTRSAYADEPTPYANGSTISLTLSGDTNLTANAETGKTTSVSRNFSITSSGLSEYSVTVQTADGADSSLTGTSSKTKIPSITANKAYSAISDNEWGYAIGASGADATTLTYKPVPASGSVIAPDMQGTGNINGNYSINFAAKFGTNTTADHYRANVLLSAVAGAEEINNYGVGFAGYTYMQDLNSTACNTIPIGAEGRLIDNRDKKVYWVGKLNDGKCWMTQNLDYDGGGTKLTTTNSWSNSTTSTQYYDPGDYILTTPTIANQCYPSSKWPTSLSQCTSNGWKLKEETNNSNIGGLAQIGVNWVPTYDWNFVVSSSYPSLDGKTTCTKTAGSMLGSVSSYSECGVYYYAYQYAYEHYSVGNYYSWNAATLNSGTSLTNASAPNSICPSNWKLPYFTSNTSGDFYKLTQAYGITNGSGTNIGLYVTKSPFYFTNSGFISTKALQDAGKVGGYWGEYSQTADYAGDVHYDITEAIGAYGGQTKQYGFTVRCIVK